MIYPGQKSIDYLAGECRREDPGESSHWRKYHAAFRFSGHGFDGLQGFGGCGKPHTGLRWILHRALQERFRRMGAPYSEFPQLDRLGGEISAREGRAYDLDVLRQVLTLAFLRQTLPDDLSARATACVIGDGFATMATLLLASRAAGRVILINLTKTLLVDLWYLRLWMGAEAFESQVVLVTDREGLHPTLDAWAAAGAGQRVVAIQAMHHALLQECPVDVAVNIASMQEMDPPVIAAYFDDLRKVATRRSLFFYCCNREEKVFPDGTVTRFSEYPWKRGDRFIDDGFCPWHQFYYSMVPPFYRPYDGPIRHRLVELAS
jgi:putative sugar O-methyltransferase